MQALRVSMEEQRARQEDEAKKTAASIAETTAPVQEIGGIKSLIFSNILLHSVFKYDNLVLCL